MGILKNGKHEHFAQLRVKGVSATEAAIGAGYSERRAAVTGCELLKVRNVIVRITELTELAMERATEKTGIDKAWVMTQLVEVVSMGKAAEPVTDAQGNPIGQYKQNLAAATKALELIGKEFKMFVERKEVLTGPLDSLEHEELKAIKDAISAITEAGIAFTPSISSTRH
jgi:phage terminase small subunit